MSNQFDVIIAGGGLAGVLAAVNINRRTPEARIAIFEKDQRCGGRLRSTSSEEGRWSYGLRQLPADLFQYWDQALKDDPEGQDLPAFVSGLCERAGVLAGNKISEVAYPDLFGTKGARAVAGGAAVRDWQVVDKFVEAISDGKKVDQTFANVWQGTRKSPSALVLEQISSAWGIPDLWGASAGLVHKRAAASFNPTYIGRWEAAIEELFKKPALADRLTIKTGCRIIGANFAEGEWGIVTEQGAYTAKALVVAQSAWDALQWLPRDHVPAQVVMVATKAKPVSTVVLSSTIKGEHDLPQLVFVPAEGVQAWIHGEEACFQVTLDYEITLQAPQVTKAIKRLKRARRKLQAAYPDLEMEGDHLVLLPVGWAQPTSPGDRKWFEKMKPETIQGEHLVFCGDSYGNSFDAGENFVNSLTTACEKISL